MYTYMYTYIYIYIYIYIHIKMGSVKDRNGRDLKEAEDIRRGGKNTQKNYPKKSLRSR